MFLQIFCKAQSFLPGRPPPSRGILWSSMTAAARERQEKPQPACQTGRVLSVLLHSASSWLVSACEVHSGLRGAGGFPGSAAKSLPLLSPCAHHPWLDLDISRKDQRTRRKLGGHEFPLPHPHCQVRKLRPDQGTGAAQHHGASLWPCCSSTCALSTRARGCLQSGRRAWLSVPWAAQERPWYGKNWA